jgi:hypothetical protein
MQIFNIIWLGYSLVDKIRMLANLPSFLRQLPSNIKRLIAAKDLVEAFPEDYLVWLALGHAYNKFSWHDAAYKAFICSLDLCPHSEKYKINKLVANSLYGLGMFNESRQQTALGNAFYLHTTKD